LTQDSLTNRGVLFAGERCFARPVRRVIYSEDFDEIYRQQLAIPIHVPKELEQYIERTMRNVCSDHGMDWSDKMNVLIPILNGTPNTPPPGDVSWHIRFWVIGNTTMWAKLDPRIDEYYLPPTLHLFPFVDTSIVWTGSSRFFGRYSTSTTANWQDHTDPDTTATKTNSTHCSPPSSNIASSRPRR
jgi:hypothetical protein